MIKKSIKKLIQNRSKKSSKIMQNFPLSHETAGGFLTFKSEHKYLQISNL